MVWNILKLMLTRGLSMKRWNNFPRIEDVSHLDNVWFVMHVALFLAYLEEKQGHKIDREFLLKRIIFNSFSSLILSDISSWTRDYILKIDDKIFKEIESKAFSFILDWEAPEYLKNDIKTTLNNTDKELELSIIEASKKYAWFIECKINEKVFWDIYEVPLSQIHLSLEDKRKDLVSLDMLLKNDNYKKYLTHIRRLSHSMRWMWQTRIFPISVMSHLIVITFISYIIWKIENDLWANYNIEELMLRSIYHDIPEAITWDIITPTKKAVKWFEEVLEQVEINMMDDYIFSYVDLEYKNQVFDFMLKPFEWELWKVAKQADMLSALFEAKIERDFWAKVFGDIYRNIKKRVNKYWTISVDYMLKNWIDSFDEKTLTMNIK